MKHISTALLLLSFSIFNTGCVKDLLKKKKKEPVIAPESKFYGTWKITSRADDFNNNNIIDVGEIGQFAGNSELKLNEGKTFTYSLTTASGSSNLSGNWTISADQKSITTTDAAQGNLRFDYRSDTEMQTEPIPTVSGTVWLIYKKQ
jgi:Lipocalin-like domain